jgi:hypothetical protein
MCANHWTSYRIKNPIVWIILRIGFLDPVFDTDLRNAFQHERDNSLSIGRAGTGRSPWLPTPTGRAILAGMTDSSITPRCLRRTSFRRLDGSVEFASDDWCLEDVNGQPLARIY